MVPLPIPRPISERELAVITAALERAGSGHFSGDVSRLRDLRVVARCECGCPSVDFATTATSQSRPIADGLGMERRPDDVGIIVWGISDEVTSLEIYSAGGQDVRELPAPSTIRSFESAGKATLK